MDTFQILVAANKAVRSLAAKKMTTRSVYAETIFNLSPTKNVSIKGKYSLSEYFAFLCLEILATKFS